MEGEVVLMHIWDAGGEIDLKKVEKIAGQSPELAGLRFERAAPAYITVSPKPLEVGLRTRKVEIFGKDIDVKFSARVYSIGAVAITMRVQYGGEMEGLVRWAQPLKIEGRPAKDYTAEVLKDILGDIGDAVVKSYPPEEEPEEYLVFVATKPVIESKKFMRENGKTVAALLLEEDEWEKLSDEEVADATESRMSYFGEDVVVVGWNAAFVLEPHGSYEDTLLTIELANLQLLELRTYDDLFDERIASAQKMMAKLNRRINLSSRIGKVAAEIAEMHTEMNKYVADTMNITKFLGEYRLARLYQMLQERLHITDWWRSAQRKLETLRELWQFATDRMDAQRGVLLEVIIILLILGEIVLALMGRL